MFASKKSMPASFVLAAIFVFSLSGFVTAQTETARVQGTVTDVAGAVLPGTTVTVTNLANNRTSNVQTNDDGEFSILSLSPGRYQIEVTQANFKTVRQEITLEVQ